MKLKSILIVACIGMMFAACSNHSEEEYSLDNTKEIKLTANISNLSTRATEDADLLQNTAFQDNELINIYMTKSSPKWEDVDAYYSSGSPLTKNTAGSTKFQFKTSGGALNSTNYYTFRFPETGTVNIYGYYPSTVTSTSTSFTIQQDQSTPENYRKSDLMVAKLEGVSPSSSPINLKFYHQLVKVIIKLKPGTGVTESDLSDATIQFWSQNTIKFSTTGLNKNTANDFSFNLPVITSSNRSQYISNVGDEYYIKLGTYNSAGNAAIILPTYAGESVQNDELIEITIGGTLYGCFAAADYPAFLSGHKYTIEVTVNKDNVKITNTSVEDWTDGESCPDESIHI